MDKVSIAMQNEIVHIASQRLGHPLSSSIIDKVCQNKWSYMGLESIIDFVKTLEIHEIEDYLSSLD